MERSRRSFLKIAGISALGMGAKPVLDVFAISEEPEAKEHAGEESAAEEHGAGVHGGTPRGTTVQGKNALTAKHWGMVVDTRKIKSSKDLKPLFEACHTVHNVPHHEVKRHEIKWIWEEAYHNAFPMQPNKYLDERIEHIPLPVLCNHCEDPPCVRACPTKATFKRERDGLVLMDFHRCIGCRFCMAACPFGARSFNFRDPRPFIEKVTIKFPTRTRGVVEKCNFCAERLAEGKIPACVEVSKGILTFGDLDDPESEVRKLLKENYTIRRKQMLGTEPSVYYIV